MKRFNRGDRRHNEERIKDKWRKVVRQEWRPTTIDEATIKCRASKLSATHTPCSCFMCGNPRRKFSGKNKLTRQEQIANLNKASVAEWYTQQT